MKTIEILDRLQKVNFTSEQAREIADILEDSKEDKVTREYVDMVVNQAKYDLVKWIVAGVVMNGVVATILKYLG